MRETATWLATIAKPEFEFEPWSADVEESGRPWKDEVDANWVEHIEESEE